MFDEAIFSDVPAAAAYYQVRLSNKEGGDDEVADQILMLEIAEKKS